MKTTARIIADVKPDVKEKLVSLSKDMDVSMTEILTKLIEAAYKQFNK